MVELFPLFSLQPYLNYKTGRATKSSQPNGVRGTVTRRAERTVQVCCLLNYNLLLEMEMFARMTAGADGIPRAPAPAAAPAQIILTTITEQTGMSQTQNMKWK